MATQTLYDWCQANNRSDLLSEWSNDKNGDLTPKSVSRANRKKVWWDGQCGHSWFTSCLTRTSQGCGCPICAKKDVAKRVHEAKMKNGNTLADKFPDLALEWNYEKNNPLTPSDVTPGTKHKVWWKCSRFGHEWQASVGSRTGMGSGCPYCKITYRVSFNEKAIAFYLSKITQIISSYRPSILQGKEIDIFLPELNLGIEYDGVYGHKIARDRGSKDSEKTKLCKESGITLIRVRETGLPPVDDCICFSTSPRPKLAEESITKVVEYVSKLLNRNPPTVNIDRDYTDILREKELAIKTNSLGVCYPELIPEWNESRNYPMSVFTIRANTDHKVWWKCEKGHEWQAVISSRVRGHGCPFCSGRNTVDGKTDLSSTYPELSKEWDYEKNSPLTPDRISSGSSKIVWWVGPCGHSWEAAIYNRTRRKSGCPYCSKPPVKILVGFNDLATTNPQLAKEWNYDKNDKLTPQDIMAGSNKKIWWKCQYGHEWQATVNARNRSKTGCPICIVPKKYLDPIGVTHPQLVSEWDYEKNDNLSPDTISAGSEKLIWWKCEKGHSWSASPYIRCKLSSSCPICSGHKILSGFNDLKTTNPELAAEWAHDKNLPLTPEKVSIKMDRTIWWKCQYGHEWQAQIRNRISSGCPYCSGSKVIPGKNDLATLYPKLVKEWDYDKNMGILPNQVTSVTSKKYWWICEQGHSWSATVSNRTKGKTGCPVCSGKRRKL